MARPSSEARDDRATVAFRRAQRPDATPPGPLRGAAPLDRAQDALPGPLRGIPLQAWLAGTGLALIVALTITTALTRSDKEIVALEQDAVLGDAGAASPANDRSARPTAAASPAKLGAAELDAARVAGVDALTALARRFPDEPTVLQALCVALARDQKDYAGALRVMRHLIDVAPEKRGDKDVQEALIATLNGPPEPAAEAFELLKTKMDAAGPDILFELLQGATGKYAKEHVAAALADPEMMRSASKALLIADELRRKMPCSRKALLPRVAAEGDARSLPFLRSLVGKNCGGGGFIGLFRGGGECYACFTAADRAAITSAIEAIEKRDKR